MHDDFKFEPVRGLPEALPRDEHIIWQGSPNARRLWIEAFKARWIAGYFAVLALWRFGVSSADASLAQSAVLATPFLIAGAVVLTVLYGLAYIQSRATVYTLTNKRVGMRIGAALTMTLNLPYPQIEAAQLDLRKGGTGTLAFLLPLDTRLSYLMTWPHVRPGHINRTQAALRCIPDAQAVARLFADAAETRLSAPTIERRVASLPHAVAAE
ncbi:PH domain-containing protein [Loktanella fryxellensis]|uniref:PH domain-containing protein n=1 Tax=Loktanella fryxellensis TaxID=245187 RepID=A0A1H8CNG6_9RHOB|nr:photosynthetic complex putative assembly protein PuhB [Loktanella fryxellensis]SEM96580.1 PH domain-containing protein [Loktanella fryxellensis]